MITSSSPVGHFGHNTSSNEHGGYRGGIKFLPPAHTLTIQGEVQHGALIRNEKVSDNEPEMKTQPTKDRAGSPPSKSLTGRVGGVSVWHVIVYIVYRYIDMLYGRSSFLLANSPRPMAFLHEFGCGAAGGSASWVHTSCRWGLWSTLALIR